MKRFCESLREHAMKIINFKMTNRKLLTNEQQESYKNAKICYICKEEFKIKYMEDKKCDLEYSVPKKLPIAFHNRSNYNYHFIIKELPEEFEKQFTCLGGNIECLFTN